MMNVGYGGILGVLILIGDIWALINILQSSVENGKKLLWVSGRNPRGPRQFDVCVADWLP